MITFKDENIYKKAAACMIMDMKTIQNIQDGRTQDLLADLTLDDGIIRSNWTCPIKET